MARYYPEPERIFLEGLGELQAVQKARKKICTTSKIANDFLHQAVPFAGRNVEYFAVVCLNTKNEPIAIAIPHKGGRNATTVDISVVLQAVLLAGATSFLVAHNHPSQDAAPSPQDVELVKHLRRAADAVKLNMLDSLILTDRENVYSSFQDMGLMRE